MPRARPVLPGKLYLCTRRCIGRQYLLRPSKRVNQAVLYCLGLALTKPDVNVQLMWLIAMSNHLHDGLFDPDGSYPRFLEHFHKLLARVLNCHWGRWGKLFEDKQTSMVELADAAAVFDKMVYSLANPVNAHLVKRASEWPGVSSLQAQLSGEELVIRRPNFFFPEDTKLPEEVRIRFHRPPQFAHLSQPEWARMIREALRQRARRAMQDRRASGGRVLGVGRVLAQSAFDSPDTQEPRRNMSPRVATRDKWRRIEVLQRNKAWLVAYDVAREAFNAGDREVAFPAGTWKLWYEHDVTRLAA